MTKLQRYFKSWFFKCGMQFLSLKYCVRGTVNGLVVNPRFRRKKQWCQ
uniref:Uncharacterized protein n=1 Tax=Anguilla anguilla TaxID=7936 RepID=A0A0E9RNX5_ANGAN